VGFDFADDPLDLLLAHRALVTRLLESRTDLLAVERHPRAVLLDDLERRLFDLLVGREPPTAFPVQTFPPTPDHKLFAGARVDDFCFGLAAERTEHAMNRLMTSGFRARPQYSNSRARRCLGRSDAPAARRRELPPLRDSPMPNSSRESHCRQSQ